MRDQDNGKELQLSGGFSLQPKTMEEAMQFAKLMADSDLVPAAYKNKTGNVIIAVQMGAELGIKPLQAVQNIAVINGKPSIYGDIGTAILRSAGFKIHLDDTETIRKNLKATCTITRPNGEIITRTFSKEDAEKAGLWGKAGPWTNYTWRQMGWRAFWFAARDGAADLLKGMSGAEEIIDIPSDTVTTEIHMPKRTTDPAPEVPKAELADPTTPSTPAVEQPVEATITISEVKKFNDGHFDVSDSEGVVYSTTDESLAKVARDARGKQAVILFQPSEGKVPVLVGCLPVVPK